MLGGKCVMKQKPARFIADVSSNHHRDIRRCEAFIRTAARIGCDAVKFQLFRVDQLFAPEILQKSAEHRQRKEWELPLEYLPILKKICVENGVRFTCSPFYLKAVEQLAPYVSFFKIDSYELLWDDLLVECAKSRLPLILSTGMASLDEIDHAIQILEKNGVADITLLHCVSAYPAPMEQCNLSVIQQLRQRYGVKAGWSDHSVSPSVIYRAIHRWQADTVEFYLDLDKRGEEFSSGHCWLPYQIQDVINNVQDGDMIDGIPEKRFVPSEQADRDWRTDPSDGLRPLKSLRATFSTSN